MYIVGRNADELEIAKKKIGKSVSAIQGDVTSLDDLDRIYKTISSEKGALHVVVASAGIFEHASLDTATPEHYDKTFGVNTRGLFFTVQKALPLMAEGGAIVLISSAMHTKGAPGYSTYSASKAAVRSFARSWASELKDKNIRVNNLSPGATDTPILDRNFASPAEAEEGKKQFGKMMLLGRVARPEEVASAALFLASSDSSYMTGADLPVDGGTSQV